MELWYSIVNECRSLLAQGGVVLWIILGVGVWLYSVLIATWHAASPMLEKIRSGVIDQALSEGEVLNEYAIYHLEQLSWVDRRLPVIGVMIGACTLGGLLGTVSGMLKTFENMASSSQVDPLEKIASGISEALITTQAGLLIALPAAFLFVLLKSRVKALHEELEVHLHGELAALYGKENQ